MRNTDTAVPACRLLRMADVEAEIGYRKSAIHQRINDGLFVRGVSLNGRAVRYPSNEVAAIVAAYTAGFTDSQVRHLVERLHAARTVAAAALLER